MAKKDSMFVNMNGADLILPGGIVIANRQPVALTAEHMENLGVQSWIADGLLVAESAVPRPVADELAAAKADRDGLAAENADLKAQIAALTAPKGE